jgi:Flp pilus assembly protein CpaB
MKKSRFRSLILPVGLAVLAAVLIGAYVVSYRDSVNNGADLVKVYVAAKDIPAGTGGSAVASGDYLKTQTVPRRAVVPGSVVSEASLNSQVVADPIYEGEQITLRQFAPKTQGGVYAKFSGQQRAIAVLGEPQQLLAGTLADGDHVDVVATARYHVGPSRATTKVVLRDLLVLKAPDGDDVPADMGSGEKVTATLVMTDRQTQTMGWAMKMSSWFLALRPTDHPRDSEAELETLHSFLAKGLPRSTASAEIIGNFPEAVDEP